MSLKIDIRDKLLRIEDVCELTTFSKSAIWLKVASHNLPKPFKLPGSSISLWRGSTLMDWIDKQSSTSGEEV